MDTQTNTVQPEINASQSSTKFCKHCGAKIPEKAVICTACGCQVEQMHSEGQSTPNIVINNSNSNVNTNQNINGFIAKRTKNKWVSLILCIFLGYLGAHKFYEGKAGMGILYLFTCGLFGIGWFIDIFVLLFKPNPYFV